MRSQRAGNLPVASASLSDQPSPIRLRHDFYEVDYLPENGRICYTIHPEARREILKRLPELNHRIHEEEVKAGLWDKKKTPAKKHSKNSEVNEPEVGYGDLFAGKGFE